VGERTEAQILLVVAEASLVLERARAEKAEQEVERLRSQSSGNADAAETILAKLREAESELQLADERASKAEAQLAALRSAAQAYAERTFHDTEDVGDDIEKADERCTAAAARLRAAVDDSSAGVGAYNDRIRRETLVTCIVAIEQLVLKWQKPGPGQYLGTQTEHILRHVIRARHRPRRTRGDRRCGRPCYRSEFALFGALTHDARGMVPTASSQRREGESHG